MDNEARDLQRKVALGDSEAGIRLAHLGTRSNNTKYLSEGLLGCLSILSYDELHRLQYAVADAISKQVDIGRKEDPKSFGTVKAVEFNLSELGTVTLGELVKAVEDFVEQVRKYPNEAAKSRFLHQSVQGYSRRSIPDCIKKAEEVFSEYKGDYVIAANGGMRIYALKRELSPEEKAERKLVLERKKLEKELESFEAKKAKLVKQLEEQKRREARLKARLNKIGGDEEDGSQT